MVKDSNAGDNLEQIARGVAQSGVRIANERAVLTLVALVPGLSNADLARRSGLGPQTTSRIVTDLEARGLVMRGEVAVAASPPRRFSSIRKAPSPSAWKSVGVILKSCCSA